MLRQSYIGDGNPYGIGNFGGCGNNCGGDFMASYCCAIITDGITVTPIPDGDEEDSNTVQASNIKVEDANDLFIGDNVETILTEIGNKLSKTVVDIKFSDIDELIFTLSDGTEVNLGEIPGDNADIKSISGGDAPV